MWAVFQINYSKMCTQHLTCIPMSSVLSGKRPCAVTRYYVHILQELILVCSRKINYDYCDIVLAANIYNYYYYEICSFPKSFPIFDKVHISYSEPSLCMFRR